MRVYLELMYNFSLTYLQNILGHDVIENLNEWDISVEEKLSKKKMIEMIDCLYGNSLLKDRNIIESLICCMHEQQVRDFCKQNYPGLLKNSLETICKKIAGNWGNNKESYALLKLWQVEERIFESEKTDEITTVTKVSAADRFYELLDYQFYIKQQALHILNSEMMLGRFLIHMPTGTGKTKTAMHIITHYINFSLKKQGLVIWIAHTKELLQQAYDTFTKTWNHLGDGDISAYRIWSNNVIENVDKPLSGIMFCGIQKLMAIENSNKSLFDRLVLDCRLLVFDEAHKAAATETRRIIEAFMIKKESMDNRFLMGLTATPGRTTDYSSDNERFAQMFENRIISIDAAIISQLNMGRQEAINTNIEQNIIKYFQNRRILSKMIKAPIEYEKSFSAEELKILSRNDGNDYTRNQLEVFARNKNRNREIMKKLRVLYSEHKPTIVFACSVLHAKILSAMLTLEEIPNCVVSGDMPVYDREKAIEFFKNKNNPCNIIINYEVLTTGFDSTNIQCVFITRPTKSIVLYSQMLGRGLRGPMMGGQEECLLVDIKDNLESFDNEKAFSYFDSYWNK